MSKRCALFFGSFNPIHKGHLAVAESLVDMGVERVCLVVSPKNPFKDNYDRPAMERLEEVKAAVCKTGLPIEVSDMEFGMVPPYYTINTLRKFRESDPDWDYIYVMGADCLAAIERWHSWKEIFDEFEVWCYPREGFDAVMLCKKYGAKLIDGELVNISSTMIREGKAEAGL